MSESVARELARLRERAEAAPDDAEVWFQLGSALDGAGYEADAIVAYERVFDFGVDRLPEDDRPRLFVQTGSTLRNLGRFNEARKLLEEGRNRFPDVQALGVFLALVEISDGAHPRAIGLLFDALLNRIEADTSIQDYHRALRGYANELDLGRDRS